MRILICFLLAVAIFPAAANADPISEADLLAHIKILAGDEFEGREPGTIGENKTINYLATQWQQAGLKPAAGDGSWYDPVTLVERRPETQNIDITLSSEDRSRKIKVKQDQVRLRGAMQNSALDNVQMVFAGYANQDVSALKPLVDGKLAIIMFTAPRGIDDFPGYQSRKKALLEAGAWGVITLVEGKKLYERSARRMDRGSTTLDGNLYHANVEGLISQSQFKKFVRKAGYNLKTMKTDAAKEDFLPIAFPLYADVSVDTNIRKYTSHNVIGRIPGKNPTAGAILYLGHWDHFGKCGEADEANPEKDLICNGAVDNASGMALLIEVAERLGKAEPDRDIYFLGTTAEEKGLLGARAFMDQPSFELDRLEAVFNADTVALSASGDLVAVVGWGKTDLDKELEAVAELSNREIDKTDKANAFLKRQDGWVFLEKDIPAFMITSAFSDQEALDRYLNGRYHDASDEADEELELGGATDDANFHVALGRYFASTDTFPQKASGE